MSVESIIGGQGVQQECKDGEAALARRSASLDEAARLADEKVAAWKALGPEGRRSARSDDDPTAEGRQREGITAPRVREVGSRSAGPGGPDDLSRIKGKHCEIQNQRESKANPTQTPPGLGFEVRCVGCRNRFCPECCKSLGIKLKERLIKALDCFKSVMMLTLTIDPALFTSPEAAYRHVREKRALSRLMRELHKNGQVRSRRFFYVIEFQPSGNPHWHLLVDSDHVDFDDLTKAWNRCIPDNIDPTMLRSGLGAVHFSPSQFCDAAHAAHYVSKYLTKKPNNGFMTVTGFPEWVEDFHGEIRRYGVSRGFWQDAKPRVKSTKSGACVRRNVKRKTIRERLQSCGVYANLYSTVELSIGDKVFKCFNFLGRCVNDFVGTLERLGIHHVGQRSNQLSCDDAKTVLAWINRPASIGKTPSIVWDTAPT